MQKEKEVRVDDWYFFWGIEGDLQVFPMNRLKGKVTFNH